MLVITGIIATFGTADCKTPLVISSVPWQKTAILEEIYQPLIRLAEQTLETEVRFFVARDYRELGNRLASGAAHIGIFGPKSYVDAKDRFPGIIYLATCMQPTTHYNSIIIVCKGADIHFLEDLTGKSFGFTSKSSTSGYVYPLLMLGKKDLVPARDFSITYFLEKHDKVYDAVAKGAIDAGGVSTTALERARSRNGDVYKIIATSDPIPRNAVVAGPHLEPERLSKIKDLLKIASRTAIFRNSDSILWGFAIKSDSFYDIIREARQILP